jgi:AhpD family alkylhydroperoxidase
LVADFPRTPSGKVQKFLLREKLRAGRLGTGPGGIPDGPRIPPLPPRQWPKEMRQAIAALQPPNPRHPFPPRRDDRPKGLNALGTLARHPALTSAFHTFNGHVQFATTLSPRQRELLVLRVASLRGCKYEWAQHVVLAGDAGMSSDEIARIAKGPEAPGWSTLERAMLAAADELVGDAMVTEATWAVLASELDEQQLMDLVFTVGSYEVLAMAFRSFGIELDDDLRK